MLNRPYSYTVLRYLHDPSTFEFVNVGVLMLCPPHKELPAVALGRTRTSVGRLKDFFPVERSVFRETMRSINRLLQRLAGEASASADLFPSACDALALARQGIPADSSSLQWSPLMAGLTADPAKTFESIFRRMVTKYDVKSQPRRSDDEVWRPVRQQLDARHVGISLEKKTIVGDDDKIEFQHAWKNGVWHAYEAVSLDLADAEGIYRKAHRWLGQLTSVVPAATEKFIPHFIVGAPSDPRLATAYGRAVKILKKSPGGAEVYEEDEIDKLVDRIEDEYKAHLGA